LPRDGRGFRQAFREVFARQPGLEVVADVGSVAEAIEYVADHMIDAAVVDIVLPEEQLRSHVQRAPVCLQSWRDT
jgi:DNA-binding NarL/FixJ family response regulator